MIDVLVIGAGPAGVLAALRAADLGARTALLTHTEFGGMAATTDQFRCGPWPTQPGCFAKLDSWVNTA